jgi:predicted RNA-binding protein with PUA-like domain
MGRHKVGSYTEEAMAYWILKTEPTTYGFEKLAAEKTARWDGVSNPVAVRNIRAMKKGDEVAIYHTGDEKAAVGVATVVSDPYDDPSDSSGKLAVVDLKAGKKLARPVTLAEMKAEPLFADAPIVRQPRLSVSPLTATQWKHIAGS